MEPRSELCIPSKLIQTLERPEECILYKLFSFVTITRQANREREPPILVPIHQHGIPASIPRPNLINYVPVGIVHIPDGLCTLWTTAVGILFQTMILLFLEC